MPMVMDDTLDVDDLFGDPNDPNSLELNLNSAALTVRGLPQRLDELRLLGCCRYVLYLVSSGLFCPVAQCRLPGHETRRALHSTNRANITPANWHGQGQERSLIYRKTVRRCCCGTSFAAPMMGNGPSARNGPLPCLQKLTLDMRSFTCAGTRRGSNSPLLTRAAASRRSGCRRLSIL